MNVPVAHVDMVEDATIWSIATLAHVYLVTLDATVKQVQYLFL